MTGSHISLFSGVGMTDLAAEKLGFETIYTAEIDPFCRSVLKTRFPRASHLDDVRKVTRQHFAMTHGTLQRPLLVSGGFPCQDVSVIGGGKGVAGGTRSSLWKEYLRVIREFRPDYVLIENSPMLRSRGLDIVLRDLDAAGYDAQWDCIPAAAVGAPHLRDRIFIVAVPTSDCEKGVYPNELCDVSDAGKVKLPRCGELLDGYVYERTPGSTIKDAKAACLAHAVACPATPTGAWPTPAASMPQDGEKPETWLARRDKLKAKGINGNGAGMPLAIAVKMYPTPRAAPNEWRTTKNAPSHGKGHGKTLAGEVNDQERAAGRTPAKPSDSCGNLNPRWVEWLMGLPADWTNPDVPNDQLPKFGGWSVEPTPRTIADPPHRKGRLMALGNGLVPQVAEVALRWVV